MPPFRSILTELDSAFFSRTRRTPCSRSDDGTASGTVRDAGGRPLAGVSVALQLAGSSVIYSSTITNHAGVSFSACWAGSYDLIVEAPIFSSKRSKPFRSAGCGDLAAARPRGESA